MTNSTDAVTSPATPATASGLTAISAGPLADALQRLARGASTDLSGLLHDVETHAVVDETKVSAHCYCLKLDGNGRPRIESLVAVVTEQVLDYAIPRGEIKAAYHEFNRSGSAQKIVRLHNNAKKLFTDLEQSGEGGELLLFVLAEKLLRLPQLICKMSLKTNARMHVHGADGMHAGVDAGTGKLLLYWGESKIYSDVTAAVRECLASIKPMLTEHNAGERDLQLLQRHADLADVELENALKAFLDPDSVSFNSVEFRGLCLVGFDCAAYPTLPSTSDLSAVVAAITASLPAWKKHVGKRITEEDLDAFAMHFLFVPFPSADGFRQLIRDHLELAPPSGAPASASGASSPPASPPTSATVTATPATPTPTTSAMAPRATPVTPSATPVTPSAMPVTPSATPATPSATATTSRRQRQHQ